jgi:hypothetical protein
MPGGELYALCAVSILNHQFPALVLIRFREEQRRRNVRTNALPAAGDLADRVVHMSSKRQAPGVAVEQRRENLQWQRCGNEQRILPQRVQHEFTKFARRRRALRQLHVVFGFCRLVAGGHAPVHPVRRIENLPGAANLARRQ